MKAFVLNKYGSLEDTSVCTSIPKPTITRHDEVIVKVAASSVNPFDCAMCRGHGKNLLNLMRWLKLGEEGVEGKEFPLTLGRDFSGIVQEVGDSVVKFRPGDEVYGACLIYQKGAMAEYVVVTETCIAKKPRNISFVEAASLPYVALTFWSASVGKGMLGPDSTLGKRVLIHAGTGGVGSFAIQLVKVWGGHVVTTCSTSGVSMVKRLGADEIVDYKKECFYEVLKHSQKFDFILFNLRNEQLLWRSAPLLSKGGMLSSLHTPTMRLTNEWGAVMGLAISLWRYSWYYIGQRLRGRYLAWSYYAPNQAALEVITDLVEKGLIKPQVEKVVSLDDAREAYKHVAEGHSRGKTVVRVAQLTETE